MKERLSTIANQVINSAAQTDVMVTLTESNAHNLLIVILGSFVILHSTCALQSRKMELHAIVVTNAREPHVVDLPTLTVLKDSVKLCSHYL